MLTNYFKIAWRNLLANKVNTIINVIGLSIAIASAITVFLILKNFWTLDNFHVNGERIYMLEYTTDRRGELETYGDAPAPMATVLANYPQVKQTVRIGRESVSIYYKESTFDELVTYADTNFFNLFTFPLRYGSPASLRDPEAVIISHKMAEKYFPNQNPVGQPFMVITAEREKKQFVIRGVAEQFPNNAGFKFDLLTGFHPIHATLKKQDWTTFNRALFAEINNPADVPVLTKQLNQYVAIFNAKNPDNTIKSFVFDNLHHPATNAYDVIRRPTEANHPITTLVFSAMALVMMALSCFNYVNISLGSVTQRLKEIGIRKVMGSTRAQLIAQFMTENILLCLVSLAFGLVFTVAVLIPLFNNVMVMSLSLDIHQNAALWLFLAGILAFTAIASGAYPSFYLSALRPIVVFASRKGVGQKSVLSRILLTVQFSLAFTSVILGVVASSTGMAWQKLDWGYNPDNTLAVRLTDSTQYALLKNELRQNPAILSITGSEEHIGESMARQEIKIGTEPVNVARYNVGADYLQTVGLKLASGRFFSTDRLAENTESIVVNEAFVTRHRWKNNAEGRTIHIDKKPYTIIGIVKNFKQFGSGAIRPSIFLSAEDPKFNYLIARFAPGNDKQVVATLTSIWHKKFAQTPLSHFFQKDVFDSFNTSFQNVARSFGYIAGLALLIACMGLYGLAAQHFSRRLKEVSVRKVMGATVSQIIVLINRQFVVLLILAGLIANVLCYVSIRLLIQQAQDFTGTYQPGLWPYLVANLIVFVTAVVAVGNQSWKLANAQLAITLRYTD